MVGFSWTTEVFCLMCDIRGGGRGTGTLKVGMKTPYEYSVIVN